MMLAFFMDALSVAWDATNIAALAHCDAVRRASTSSAPLRIAAHVRDPSLTNLSGEHRTKRPSMRFVGVRSLKNQAALMRHKAREMLVSQRTQLLNGLRGHLTEIGVIAAQGPRHARELAELIEACDETIPFEVCEALAPLVVQLRNLDEAIARVDRTIAKMAQQDETARRLMSIPGFGPITASAMAATIQDTSGFAGPREFAAYLGLTPKQSSSGGKPKL